VVRAGSVLNALGRPAYLSIKTVSFNTGTKTTGDIVAQLVSSPVFMARAPRITPNARRRDIGRSCCVAFWVIVGGRFFRWCHLEGGMPAGRQ
jgi:hypothetical protein